MVRQTLIILTIIFCSCSQGQKSKDIATFDSAKTVTINKHNFTVLSTRKCNQNNLSNQFDIGIDFKRYSDTTELHDSCALKILIQDKQTKADFDSIFLTSLFYYGNTFANCDSSTTSFTTRFNSNRQIADNYFGDMVVADFNFDNLDDIAIINDYGGNGGPLYSYFIQNNDKRFILDSFLTDSVAFFPSRIDKTRHRLITYVHAGACCVGRHIYQFDKLTNKWKQTSHKILKQNSGT